MVILWVRHRLPASETVRAHRSLHSEPFSPSPQVALAAEGIAEGSPRGFCLDEGVVRHDGVVSFREAMQSVKPLKPIGFLDRPIITSRPPRKITIVELPLRLLNFAGGTKLVHFVRAYSRLEDC